MRLFIRMLLAGAIIALAGCAAVDPWDRGRLAKPYMALDNDPIRHTAQNHVNSSREGTQAGGGGEGGGCGCY